MSYTPQLGYFPNFVARDYLATASASPSECTFIENYKKRFPLEWMLVLANSLYSPDIVWSPAEQSELPITMLVGMCRDSDMTVLKRLQDFVDGRREFVKAKPVKSEVIDLTEEQDVRG